jgi:hypothetical protein
MGRVLTLSRSFGVCIDFFSRWLNFDRQFSNTEESYREQTSLADSICAESSKLQAASSIRDSPGHYALLIPDGGIRGFPERLIVGSG